VLLSLSAHDHVQAALSMSIQRRAFLIIANPTSGGGRAQRTAHDVAALLRARSVPVDIAFTARPGDARVFAADAIEKRADLACIVACGGDGTVQEVAGSIASMGDMQGGWRPLLGLAPAGRCNDFATAFGIGTNPQDIFNVLVGGHASAVDLGRINDAYFCTVATVGIDAEVSAFVESMRMPLRGTAAYIYGAIRVLMRYKAPRLRLEGDFGVIERELLMASSANTSTYGGAIRIAPEAVPTDGQLDVCLVDPMSRLRALRLLPALMAGNHVGQPEIQFVRTRRIVVNSETPLEIWADGERVARTPATFEVAPAAIQVLCPRAATTGR